jgi:hypothetical protein
VGVVAVGEIAIPAVVPPQTDRSPGGSGANPASGVWRRVPLAELAPPRQETARVCAVATVDARGRVSDRSAVWALGWAAGLRLEIRAVSGSVLVRPSEYGLFTLTKQGYLRLPAVARHWCALRAGERVLLLAEPQARPW